MKIGEKWENPLPSSLQGVRKKFWEKVVPHRRGAEGRCDLEEKFIQNITKQPTCRQVQKKMKNQPLTKKQIDLLWGNGPGPTGPYSEANLSQEVRILDDSVSREFITVEVHINPTTFELVKKHRNDKEFKDDIAIQQLLDYSEFRGEKFGYVSMAFTQEYLDENVLRTGRLALRRVQDTIIKIHKFFMSEYLS